MDRFKQIDEKLKTFADKLAAKILTSGSFFSVEGIPVPAEYIEERRIIWTTGEIGKAIIIMPNFLGTDLATPNWDFINTAWLEAVKESSKETSSGITYELVSEPSKERSSYINHLLRRVTFDRIEMNMDQLLRSSLENLERITLHDLK